MKISAAQGAKDRAIWKQMQDDEATWSSRSQHQLVYDSSHYIQFHRPDLVINAVLSVVDKVRADTAHLTDDALRLNGRNTCRANVNIVKIFD